MGYGLNGKVRQIITSMDALRGDRENPRDISLSEFLSENYKDNDGKGLRAGHLYSELGIRPRRTTVQELMSNEDNKYLMSEIIRDGVKRGLGLALREKLAKARVASASPATYDGGRETFVSREEFLDPVRRGAVQATFYPELIIREESVGQPTVTVPKIEISDAAMKDTGEAATIEEGAVTYGSKKVDLQKKGRALKLTYESIMFNSLSLAQIFFEDIGRILGHSLNGMAVDAIINGDQADSSEAAAVVGVADTADGITWYDLARIAIQFGLLGRVGIQAIGNATTALDYLNLPEVKNKQFPGAPLLATMVKSPLAMPEDLYVSTNVADDQLVVQDPSTSIVMLTAQPLMVETDKIIIKQIEEAVASIFTGFAKIQRNASVVIDGSITFAGNGFPAWMQPYSD